MFKYISKCRWNILLQFGNEIVEIRPSELFESNVLLESRFLELVESEPAIEEVSEEPVKKKKAKE